MKDISEKMPPKRKNATNAPFQAVLSVPFLPDMQPQVEALMTDTSAITNYIISWVEQGDTFGLRPNERTDGYSASWKSGSSYGADSGYMVYGNAPTAWGAMAVLVMKVSFLQRAKDWSQFVGMSGTGGYS